MINQIKEAQGCQDDVFSLQLLTEKLNQIKEAHSIQVKGRQERVMLFSTATAVYYNRKECATPTIVFPPICEVSTGTDSLSSLT